MIGLFGGTFDPVHKGHLHLAEQARSRLALEEIQFLPCANPVHRQAPNVESHHRVMMLQGALEDYPDFVINTLEIDRGGPSFMADTLKEMLNQGEQRVICLLIGADTFNTLMSWKSPKEILTMVHLVVCHRPGSIQDKSIFADCLADSISELSIRKAGCIFPLDIEENPCSSSEVRRLLMANQSVDTCLSEPVVDYIKRNNLYGKNCE